MSTLLSSLYLQHTLTSRQHTPYRPIIPNAVLRWTVLLSAWFLFGFFMSLQSYYQSLRSAAPTLWSDALVLELTYAAVWAALTPLIFRLAWHISIDQSRWLAPAALHLLLSFLFALIDKFAFTLLFQLFHAAPAAPFSWARIFRTVWNFLDYGVMIYWMLLLLQHAYEYFRRFRTNEVEKSRLETQLARAEIMALRMQLQPHFLFNTLNSISVLIERQPEAAKAMIAQLADLLRLTLERANLPEIPLRQELEFIDQYLRIEQTRFADRLSVRREIEPEVMDAFVPCLILQPIVENAMKHGVARQRGPACIEIRAKRMNGFLRLEVQDNGPGLGENGALATEGIGLSNTHQRLRQLYGAEYRFEINNAGQGGVIAAITVPFRPVPGLKREESRVLR